MILDIAGTIISAIAAFFFIGLIVAVVIGYALYRILSSLDGMQRALVTAFLILAGFVLIISVIGAQVGVILLFSGVFTTLFSTLYPRGSEEE